MKKSIVALVLVVILGIGFVFVKKSSNPSAEKAVQRTVNLATWSNYIDPALLAEFTQKTGIQVLVSNFSSNEELLAKLQAGATGYDVAMPSDYMILVMSKLGLLHPLDLSKIPNSKDLSADLMKKSFDPENKYSLPFDWGTTGLAIHHGQFKGTVTGWNSLFKNKELYGKFTLLDDVRETIGGALKSLGYSLNSKNPEELAKAKALLLEVKPKIRGFNAEPQPGLVGGEFAVAHMYSSDALRSRKNTNQQVEYVIPEEGCTIWIDNFVIPAQAPHVEEAHALINFLLDVKSNVFTATHYFVVPSHAKALDFVEPGLKNDPMVFPPKAKLQKCEMIEDLGDALKLWDRAWTEIKTAN